MIGFLHPRRTLWLSFIVLGIGAVGVGKVAPNDGWFLLGMIPFGIVAAHMHYLYLSEPYRK